ncbi:MAG: shikimate kinase family protein [Paenibacillaceae bacterium]|jgi:adenylate kinase family enzyme|nr:shikimate kinase family protein [Paenibacillaceae bacterium]
MRNRNPMKIPKRVHIIGSTGSGKTYLAKQLSDTFNIPYFELDNAMWNRSVENPGKNPPEVRDRLLNNILRQESWIVEGVYHTWTSQCFTLADRIIFLTPNTYFRDLRIITRFIKQRIGSEKSNYKQTLKGLIKMIKWNHKFERKIKTEIIDCLKPHSTKVVIVENNKDIMNSVISSLSSDFT